MLEVEDIQKYVIKLSLMGTKSFYAKKKNDVYGQNIELIEIPDDIKFKGHVSQDLDIDYTAKQGDFLNITNRFYISPLKKSDFEKFYNKVTIQRKNIDNDL